MPLNAQKERVLGPFGGFGDAVRRNGADPPGFCMTDSLMMQGIHHERPFSNDSHQQGVILNGNGVRGITCFLLLPVGNDFSLEFRGKILINVAAQSDVHHLKPAADTENWLVFTLNKQLQQGELVGVAHGADTAALRLLILSEEQGIDILATGEKEAVASFHILAKNGFVVSGGRVTGKPPWASIAFIKLRFSTWYFF